MNNDGKALKSGFWYTFANFITRGLSFLTTPIFARLLTKEDYGLFSTFTSWVSVLGVICTLKLGSTLISARYDFEDDFDAYIRSTIGLGVFASFVGFLVINTFYAFFNNIFGLDRLYINCAIVYVMLLSVVDMYQTREQYYFRYKRSVFLSVAISISTVGLSVVLVLLLKNQLLGRVLGYSIPTVLSGLAIFYIFFKKGVSVNLKYWRYAIRYCLPFIPHLLSLSVLNSVDKIMITSICGAEQNAFYSIAYSCGTAITLILNSMNTAFAPWLGSQLQEENFDKIRKFSYKYITVFAFLSCGVMLLTPEIMLVLGGNSYMEAMYVMPPVACGCIAQFLYTMFVNIEQFKKKTIWMALASISAATVNYGLNLLFIPQHGYIAAAYTTLFSFIWLLISHMFIVWKVGYGKAYDYKYIITVLIISLAFTVFVNWLYSFLILRGIVIIVYAAICCGVVIKNREKIIEFVNRRKR